MNKKGLAILIIVIVVLCSSFVFAGFFDFFSHLFGKDKATNIVSVKADIIESNSSLNSVSDIVNNNIAENISDTLVGSNESNLSSEVVVSNVSAVIVVDNKTYSENVTCKFKDGQKHYCYSSKGVCGGIGSCVIKVNGTINETVNFDSDCDGQLSNSSIITGVDKEVFFNCKAKNLDGSLKVIRVAENVTCKFSDRESHKCYSLGGSCRGNQGFCILPIEGVFGTQLVWRSDCNEYYYYTEIDGKNDYVMFECD
jgi:hypothetical protein